MSASHYTVKELARVMSLSPDRLKEYIKRGELRAYKLGRSYRITPEAFEEFMKANTTMPNRRIRVSCSKIKAPKRDNAPIGRLTMDIIKEVN